MHTQVGRWGNSLAVRIPSAYARDLNLKEGMELEVAVADGGLVLRPRRRYTLEELVAGNTPESRHGETDWGEAAGREAW